MSAEDRRRVSAEMMARIDAVVSGHELQRSAEAAPRYVGRVEDRPLRFEGPCDACQMCGLGLLRTVPCTWCGDRRGPRGVVHHLDGNPQNNAVENLAFVDPRENSARGPDAAPPHGRCPCGAHLEPAGSFLACPECESTFQLREDGWHGPPWTIEEDGRFFGRITGDPAAPDSVTDRVGDGTTAAFFEGVDRARSRFGYATVEGEVVEFEATGPLTVTLPPGVTIRAVTLDTTPFSAPLARETRTPFREAYEALQTAWTDLRLALLDRLGR